MSTLRRRRGDGRQLTLASEDSTFEHPDDHGAPRELNGTSGASTPRRRATPIGAPRFELVGVVALVCLRFSNDRLATTPDIASVSHMLRTMSSFSGWPPAMPSEPIPV